MPAAVGRGSQSGIPGSADNPRSPACAARSVMQVLRADVADPCQALEMQCNWDTPRRFLPQERDEKESDYKKGTCDYLCIRRALWLVVSGARCCYPCPVVSSWHSLCPLSLANRHGTEARERGMTGALIAGDGLGLPRGLAFPLENRGFPPDAIGSACHLENFQRRQKRKYKNIQ